MLAIMSFTLNRVYTEWYEIKGLILQLHHQRHLTINGPGAAIYLSLFPVIVDELFADYLSRPNVRQPILTQYCDGRRVSCPNWLTQWGSKSLGEQGFSPIEILRYYYGDDMYINTAEAISGIPSSWPGYTLGTSHKAPKCVRYRKNECDCGGVSGNPQIDGRWNLWTYLILVVVFT